MPPRRLCEGDEVLGGGICPQDESAQRQQPTSARAPAQPIDARGQHARHGDYQQQHRQTDGAHQWQVDGCAEGRTCLPVDGLAGCQGGIEDQQKQTPGHTGQTAPA